jgi:predicted MFS family arabinose efflux permease
MPPGVKRFLFALFFLSGFCGLLYQVVWVRMAFASFGVVTPVLSIVISVFMLGLFAGSWLAGKVVGPLSTQRGLSAIWLYALAELLIGAGAFAVPRLLALGRPTRSLTCSGRG